MAIVAAVVSLAVGALLGIFASRARAQGIAPGRGVDPTITYVYLRETGDTLGIEVMSRDAEGVSGTLSIKGQPRVQWTQRNSTDGPGLLTMNIFAPGSAADAKAVQTATVQMRGDSVSIGLINGTQQARTTIGTTSGAFPMVNASVLHAALIAAHARASNIKTVSVFLTSGAQTLTAAVGQVGDTVTFKLGNSDMRIVSAADGMPLVILLPGQNTRVVRAARAVSASAGRIAYDAPAKAPYVAEQVKIPSGRGYDLAATFTRPTGITKVPVVITISGSGPQDRDGRISIVPGYEFFREIADTLGRRGIAVLRFDDRGVGESGGRESAIKSTTADFADDVRSIITWLRARADVDGARIALAGHSEGGIIAPMVAAKDSRVRAIALMAGHGWRSSCHTIRS